MAPPEGSLSSLGIGPPFGAARCLSGAAFADGRWGWLAEAQGRFYMTFEREDVPADAIPPFPKLKLGETIRLGRDTPPLIVAEKSYGQADAAEGEIPYRLVPGERYPFADLSGPSGEFGTIDYGSDPPTVYLGRQVTLEELSVAERKRSREREARRVEPSEAGPGRRDQ